jgi:hypothetical protein
MAPHEISHMASDMDELFCSEQHRMRKLDDEVKRRKNEVGEMCISRSFRFVFATENIVK